MTTTPNDTDRLHLPLHAAEQFAFHLRLAVAAGAAHDTVGATCDPLLAWAVIAAAQPGLDDLAASAESELIGADLASGSADHRSEIVSAAS